MVGGIAFSSCHLFDMQGFLEFDNTMMKDEQMRDEVAGTTAVTVLIKSDQLYCVRKYYE